MRERRLADPGQILDQQVAAREQAGERQADLALLAEDHPAGLIDDPLEGDDDMLWRQTPDKAKFMPGSAMISIVSGGE